MNTAHDLEALLDEERALLVRGDYEGLAPLIERKAMLTDALDANDLPEALAHKSRENAMLLAAAARGFQAALARLRDLRETAGDATYSRSGTRETLAKHPGTIRKKI